MKNQDIDAPFEQCNLNTIVSKKVLRPLEKWMPPLSCVQRMASLTKIVVEYMVTAGRHDAFLPDFVNLDSLWCNSHGQIMYDFGKDASKPNLEEGSKFLVQSRGKGRKSMARKRLYEEI